MSASEDAMETKTPEVSGLPPTVTVEEAARVLGIGRVTAYRAVHAGEIPSIRIGRRIVIPTHRLVEMLRGDP